MRFFPVGQGDATLVTLADDARILIDAGRDGRTAELLYGALPFFDRRIDVLIISHADTDHIGGAVEVLEKFPTGLILFNGRPETEPGWLEILEKAKEKGIPVLPVSGGDSLRYGDASLKVLWPEGPRNDVETLEDNDASLVLMLEAENVRALFTGDIGFGPENAMTGGDRVRADVLKVSHHGSPNASGYYFIEAVRPSVSVVSVGENRYGHPSERVLDRLSRAGSQVYRTDADGEVHIRARNGVVEVLSCGSE